MRVIDPLNRRDDPLTRASIALGNFDGVHRGHQAVIDAARRDDAPLAVAVFDPPPRRFFQPHAAPFRLMSDTVRDRVLGELGVQAVFAIPFDRDLSMKDDRAFARDVLVDAMDIASVAVGWDYRFGRDRVGDVESLKRLGAELGFEVAVVAPVNEGAEKCSSTAVRTALQAGDVEAAARLLTRPWIIDGVVQRGEQRGRTIGFPTANVPLGDLLRPKLGVYAVMARIEGQAKPVAGVANIGRRPTFGGEDERLEAHLFDFEGDLYGRRLEVEIHAFIRGERKFDGIEPLKTQIALDCSAARAALLQ